MGISSILRVLLFRHHCEEQVLIVISLLIKLETMPNS
jgi:hypothetical protein